MKIVSNFKDYYDHVGKILGEDSSLRFNRTPFVVTRLLDGTGFIDETKSFIIPRSIVDDYHNYSYSRNAIFRRVGDNFTFSEHQRVKALYVGGLTFEVWRDFDGKDALGNNRYSELKVRLQVETPKWLNDVADIAGTPVFVIEAVRNRRISQGSSEVVLSNNPPILSEMGVARFLSAQLVYAQIQTWLENHRSRDIIKISPSSNEVKIQAAGFDLKTSFRKRPK